jgi:hypothetical protein
MFKKRFVYRGPIRRPRRRAPPRPYQGPYTLLNSLRNHNISGRTFANQLRSPGEARRVARIAFSKNLALIRFRRRMRMSRRAQSRRRALLATPVKRIRKRRY